MRAAINLLDGFQVSVDGVLVPEAEWRRRQAAGLVMLLALTPGRRLHRDRVVDLMWPNETAESAVPKLHKAAHFARHALGCTDAVVLRNETVLLLPDADVEVDAVTFQEAADRALREKAPAPGVCASALKLGGVLLPHELGHAWLDASRARLRLLTVELLRCSRHWEELLRLEPADEEAHVELLRAAVEAGDRGGALRRFETMRRTMAEELGIEPGSEALQLRDTVVNTPAGWRTWSEPPRKEELDGSGTPRPRAELLLERDQELSLLLGAVQRAVHHGTGAVVLVVGEAGAGKSSLVREFLDAVDPQVATAVGGCDDLLVPRPLGPFLDMAAEDPALGELLDAGPPDRVLPALLRHVGSRPTVLVVEDVHWADDSTLDVVRYLARRVRRSPTVLVLTLRETDLGLQHPLRQVLGGLTGPEVLRLVLHPLSPAAVEQLGGLPEDRAREIHRLTGGNPFFVNEVLSSDGNGVPTTVLDSVLGRLAALTTEERVALQRLSVVPSRAERDLAEVLVGEGHSALLKAERSGFLTGQSWSVQFRHELVRRAVEGTLTSGERVAANKMVLCWLLEGHDTEPARLLHHAELAGRIDVLLEHGPRAAAEAAALGAHRQAAEFLRVVLLHRTSLPTRRVADLLIRRAYSLYVVNHYREALVQAEEAVRVAEETADRSLLARALLVLSRVALFARGPLTARTAAARTVDLVSGSEDLALHAEACTELARTNGNLAIVGPVANPGTGAADYARRALQIATTLNRPALAAQALCYLGEAGLADGYQEGADDLERALAMATEDSRVETRVRCFVNAAGAAFRSGRLEDATRYVDEGLTLAADGEFFAGAYRLRLTRVGVLASSGRWDPAIEELGLLLGSEGEPGIMEAWARSLLARLLARRGDTGSAEALRSARAAVAQSTDSFVIGPVTVAEVEVGWLDGSLGAVSAEVTALLAAAERQRNGSLHAELVGYLRRADLDVALPVRPAGPWGPTLAGDWRTASASWERLGDRYETAVVLAQADDRDASRQGHAMLEELGAAGTLAAI